MKYLSMLPPEDMSEYINKRYTCKVEYPPARFQKPDHADKSLFCHVSSLKNKLLIFGGSLFLKVYHVFFAFSIICSLKRVPIVKDRMGANELFSVFDPLF